MKTKLTITVIFATLIVGVGCRTAEVNRAPTPTPITPPPTLQSDNEPYQTGWEKLREQIRKARSL